MNRVTDIDSGPVLDGVAGDSAQAAEVGLRGGAGLDDYYLVKGLTGMVRADGWFDAHWGAGVLAGYYLCRENRLEGQTVAGIKRQLDSRCCTAIIA